MKSRRQKAKFLHFEFVRFITFLQLQDSLFILTEFQMKAHSYYMLHSNIL